MKRWIQFFTAFLLLASIVLLSLCLVYAATQTVFNRVSTSNTQPAGQTEPAATSWPLNLPMPTALNNCVVATIEYETTAGVTFSVADDAGNTYSQVGTGFQHAGGQSLAMFVGKQTTAGAHIVTITFTGTAGNFVDGDAMEYNNQDGSCTVDTSAGATGTTATPSVSVSPTSCSAGTPCLIVQWAVNDATGGPISSWTPSGSWKMIGSDILNAHEMAWLTTTTTGAQTCGGIAQNAAASWVIFCGVFKGGSTGSSPTSFNGMRIDGIMHQQFQSQTGTMPAQIPTFGNTQVAQSILFALTRSSISDTTDGTWTLSGAVVTQAGTGNVYSDYKCAATIGVNRAVSIATSGVQNGSTIWFYDIVGAASPSCVDATVRDTATGNQVSAGNLSTVTSTPSAAGVLFNVTGINTGSLTGTAGSPAFRWDTTFYGGEGGTSPVDENNGVSNCFVGFASACESGLSAVTAIYTNNAAGGVAQWASLTLRVLAPSTNVANQFPRVISTIDFGKLNLFRRNL